MPFRIIRNDITKVKADAIVNSANPNPIVGSGTDYAIYQAAGYDKLLKERQKIGQISPGEAQVTKAGRLKAKYIIHTVGPLWIDGQHEEAETLASCYRKSLQLAKYLNCSSIVFPLISTGVYGFPKELALKAALKEIEAFLYEEEMDVILCVFDRESFRISSSLNSSVREFINDSIAETSARYEYDYAESSSIILNEVAERRERRERRDRKNLRPAASQIPFMPVSAPSEKPIEEILRTPAKTFQEQLLSLIDEKGLTDVQVYKKANLDRKLFSKIRSNADYVPKKRTALALAIALELDIDETKDLLARASLALSPSSPFDLIIEYCIRHQKYNVFEINTILFEYDQQSLGSN